MSTDRSGLSQDSFSCEFCEFSDSSKANVSSHLLLSHHCTILYRCTLCEFNSSLRELFSLHLVSHRCSDEVGDVSAESVTSDDSDADKNAIIDERTSLSRLSHGESSSFTSLSAKVCFADSASERPSVESLKRSRGRPKGSTSYNNRKCQRSLPPDVSCLPSPKKLKPERNPCVKQHDRDRPFHCPGCDFSFSKLFLFRRHWKKIHSAIQLFPCPKRGCSHTAKSENALNTHFLSVHKFSKDCQYECLDCGKKFVRLSILQSHIKVHVKGRSTRRRVEAAIAVGTQACNGEHEQGGKHTEYDHCSKSTGKSTDKVSIRRKTRAVRQVDIEPNVHWSQLKTEKESKAQHFSAYKKNNSTMKVDDTKEKRSMDKQRAKKEQEVKEKENGELQLTQSEKIFFEVAKVMDRKANEFPCPHCPYVGKVFRNFKEHVMGHSEQRPYVCSVCCHSFVCKSKLVRHQRQVHSEVRPFLCSECSYTGKSRSCLETHRLVMHPKEEHLRFACPHCPARFARESMMKSHAVRHNTGPHKLFSCPQCSFSTNYRRQFELHATLHTGKRCLCSLCGKAYSGQAQLRVHMKVVHTDQSFQCSLCDFVTKRSEGLTKHMKSHSTERPYACPHCDYRGKRKAHLRRHVARHTKSSVEKEPCRAMVTGDQLPCLTFDRVNESKDLLRQHLSTHNTSSTVTENTHIDSMGVPSSMAFTHSGVSGNIGHDSNGHMLQNTIKINCDNEKNIVYTTSNSQSTQNAISPTNHNAQNGNTTSNKSTQNIYTSSQITQNLNNDNSDCVQNIINGTNDNPHIVNINRNSTQMMVGINSCSNVGAGSNFGDYDHGASCTIINTFDQRNSYSSKDHSNSDNLMGLRSTPSTSRASVATSIHLEHSGPVQLNSQHQGEERGPPEACTHVWSYGTSETSPFPSLGAISTNTTV